MMDPVNWLVQGWLWLAVILGLFGGLLYWALSSRGLAGRLSALNQKLQRQLDPLLGVEDRLRLKQLENEEVRTGLEGQIKNLLEKLRVSDREKDRERESAAEQAKALDRNRHQVEDLSQQIIRLQEKSQQDRQELAKANSLAAELIAMRDDALRRLKEAQDKLVKTERLAAVSAMVISINHEINNPLTSVSLSIQSLRHQVASGKAIGQDEMLNLLDIANREADQIKKIVEKIRDISELNEVDYLPGVKMISLKDKEPEGKSEQD